ncbi:alpha/beta hydrolase fold domain-containing protein [Streptomyces sp. TRM66268-LWL]|uniref:Alpha/beta hydrolase fold domain-containing protein n=1 Tax=Streptomyces polyasparticus TaxID=2767826 RepID=A0ABR7SS52_9ACTN|nr:alpha/beta hydrolase fold domain-containing protein [Streptomyces polyasparticus]MBC9717719.1 alpha/beta hydrolase fold domain-containing protein [Streptomyces polyasparticus]
MNVSRIPATPDPATAAAEVAAALKGIAGLDLTLPEGAGTEALPEVDSPGVWVSATGSDPARGVILYAHGGGFTSRMPELIARYAHRLSEVTGRPVFVSHYRLAPADPYPAPLDDVVAAYEGLLAAGVPAGRIVLLGESSGGALVLSALLRLKSAGRQLPAGTITISPLTDFTLASPSIDASGELGVDRAMLTHITDAYLAGAARDEAPQSPYHGDLSSLPPLLMLVGTAEAFLDDTLRFAQAASTAGTKVEADTYESLTHAFQITALTPESPTGDRLLTRLSTWIDERTGGLDHP